MVLLSSRTRPSLCYYVLFLRFIPGLSSSVAVEYFQEESSCMLCLRPYVGLKENRMSRRNGDRSRFNRQRVARIHNRTLIRELWKTVRAQETTSAQKVRGKTLGSPETGLNKQAESN